MHNLITDSLIFPQNLLKYRQKNGLFVFFYVLILAVFMSLDGIIHYIWYPTNSVITTETTGCSFEAGSISCEGESYDPQHAYAFFGYSLFFLDDGDVLLEPPAQRIVLQNASLRIFVNGMELYGWDLSPVIAGLTFDDFFATMTSAVRWSGGLFLVISNMVVLWVVAFLSSISFLRIARFVRYKVIYKLLVFALTPFALLLTLYNLLDFHILIFFLLMAVSYRSVFVLLQVLTRETFLHLNEQENGGNPDPVPSSEPISEDEAETEEDQTPDRSETETEDDDDEQ